MLVVFTLAAAAVPAAPKARNVSEPSRKATLFPSIGRSQNFWQFGRARCKCSVLDIFNRQVDGVQYNCLKNILLAYIKVRHFSNTSGD